MLIPFGMDVFEEGGADQPTEQGLPKASLIALIVGALGLVLGVAGLIVGLGAAKSADKLAEDFGNYPGDTEVMRNEIQALAEAVSKLDADASKLSRQDRLLQDNTKNAFDTVQKSISENRKSIAELTARVVEIGEILQGVSSPKAPVSKAQETESIAVEGGIDVASGASGVHYVESGDTLSKIAKQYGVSLSDLQGANPTVNPRALQIGQEIVIP